MNNAIKFSLGGGIVGITVDHNPSYLWVRIQDQGIGISEEDLPQIFDRFWRMEEHEGHLFGGIGLGLSIAKQVIEQHGGTIEVGSKPGLGSVFTIKLRIRKQPEPVI